MVSCLPSCVDLVESPLIGNLDVEFPLTDPLSHISWVLSCLTCVLVDMIHGKDILVLEFSLFLFLLLLFILIGQVSIRTDNSFFFL